MMAKAAQVLPKMLLLLDISNFIADAKIGLEIKYHDSGMLPPLKVDLPIF